MEFLVPMSRMDWGFFDRQRSAFRDIHSEMDDEWMNFDAELDRIKKDMFTLSPMDFGDFGSGFGKSDLALEFAGGKSSKGIGSGLGGMDSMMDAEFKKMEREMDQEMAMMGGSGISSRPALSLTGSSSPSSSQKISSSSKSSMSSTVTETSSSSKSSSAAQQSALTGVSQSALASQGALTSASGKAASNMDSLMLKVDNPIWAGPDGKKRLTLRFNVSQFKPEEISVKTVDRNLTVHAKHTEESPGKKIYREYSKQYILPKNIDPLTLTSTLAKDGVLQIEGPAPDSFEAPRERLIPVLRLCA